MFHLKSSVEHFTGKVDVSTVYLGFAEWVRPSFQYETCLFFADESSEVVAHYNSEAEAIAGHAAFSNPEVVRYIEQIRHSRDYYMRGVDEYMEDAE